MAPAVPVVGDREPAGLLGERFLPFAGPGARGPRRSRGRPPRGRAGRAGAARPGRAPRRRPIRWVSALRRCSTGSASTPLTITAACSSETWPAAIASRTGSWSWSRALARARRRLASRLVCRVVLAHQAAVSAAPVSAPRSWTSARCGMPSSSAVTRCLQPVQRGEGWRRSRCAASTRARARRPGRRSAGDGGDRGRHRVCRVSSNAVAIQGILASGTDSPGPGMGYFGQLWRSISKVSGALDVVVSTSSTTGQAGSTSGQQLDHRARGALDPTRLRHAARSQTAPARRTSPRRCASSPPPPAPRGVVSTPSLRSLLDHLRLDTARPAPELDSGSNSLAARPPESAAPHHRLTVAD